MPDEPDQTDIARAERFGVEIRAISGDYEVSQEPDHDEIALSRAISALRQADALERIATALERAHRDRLGTRNHPLFTKDPRS